MLDAAVSTADNSIKLPTRVDRKIYAPSACVYDLCNRVDSTLRLVHSFESMTTPSSEEEEEKIPTVFTYEYEPVELATIWVHVDHVPSNSRLSFHCHKSCLAVSCKYFAALLKDDPELKEVVLPETIYKYTSVPYYGSLTRNKPYNYAKEQQIQTLFDYIHYRDDPDLFVPSIGGYMAIMYMAFYLDCSYVIDMLSPRVHKMCDNLDSMHPSNWEISAGRPGLFFNLMDVAGTIKQESLSKRFAILAANRMECVDNPYPYIYFTSADDESRFASAQKLLRRG